MDTLVPKPVPFRDVLDSQNVSLSTEAGRLQSGGCNRRGSVLRRTGPEKRNSPILYILVGFPISFGTDLWWCAAEKKPGKSRKQQASPLPSIGLSAHNAALAKYHAWLINI